MAVDEVRVRENIGELSRVLAATGDGKLLESFLSCLLTPAELADIAARWALVKALRDGRTQREIAKTLNVSLCKITRGSRELKKTGSAFQSILAVLDDLNAEGRTENGPPGPFDPNHDDRQYETGQGGPDVRNPQAHK